MKSLTLNELQRDIKRAAKAVAFQWPGVIDADDAEQAITLHLLERPNSIDKITEMDTRAQYRAIVGIGHQLASAERNDYDHFKGSFTYSVDEVKKLLNRGVLTEPVEGFDAAVFDLMEGLESMVVKTPQYVESVVSRYADNEVPTSGANAERLSASLTRLTDSMNKSSRVRFSNRDDGLGTRRVMSNSAAVNLSSYNETGDMSMSAEDWAGE